MIEIRSLAPDGDATAFRTRNEEWITRYFTLEAKDRETLNNPAHSILLNGGHIFMAYAGSEAVGCVPLIPMPDDHRPRVLVQRQDMTGAERAWATHYEINDLVRYSRGSKAAGIEAGSYGTVVGVNQSENLLAVDRGSGDPVAAAPVRLMKRDLLFVAEQLLQLLDEKRLEMVARNRSIKAKDGELPAKLLIAFFRKADEGTIGNLMVEAIILLSARSQSDGGKVFRTAAQAYGVDTGTVALKVKQEFAAKEKAKKATKRSASQRRKPSEPRNK